MTTMTNFNTVRMDNTMHNMHESLLRIEGKIQRDLIPAAEEDAKLAQQLVGDAEALEPPDINKAMEEANLVGTILRSVQYPDDDSRHWNKSRRSRLNINTSDFKSKPSKMH